MHQRVCTAACSPCQTSAASTGHAECSGHGLHHAHLLQAFNIDAAPPHAAPSLECVQHSSHHIPHGLEVAQLLLEGGKTWQYR